nr:nicotinamidase [Quercus suber]
MANPTPTDQEVIAISPMPGLVEMVSGSSIQSSVTGQTSDSPGEEDFCPPNGSLAVPGGRDIAPAINELLRQPFDLKIATRDWHPANHISFACNHGKKRSDSYIIQNPDNPEETHTTVLWPQHCVQGTAGADLIPELDQKLLNFVLNKGMDPRMESYSAFGPPFRKPALGSAWLRQILNQVGVQQVFVVGLAFAYCVKYTALDAAELGFETFVLTDCTNAIDAGGDGKFALHDTLQTAGFQASHVVSCGTLYAIFVRFRIAAWRRAAVALYPCTAFVTLDNLFQESFYSAQESLETMTLDAVLVYAQRRPCYVKLVDWNRAIRFIAANDTGVHAFQLAIGAMIPQSSLVDCLASIQTNREDMLRSHIRSGRPLTSDVFILAHPSSFRCRSSSRLYYVVWVKGIG